MTATRERAEAALLGMFIGDALSMPVHWYYDTMALHRDYGTVRDYLAPHGQHPTSIMDRVSYDPVNRHGEILHGQARYYGVAHVHYHQFLKAGENTLNLKICAELLRFLGRSDGYDRMSWLETYAAFLRTPGNHNDTYVEEYHRHFFHNVALGHDLDGCAVPEERNIGSLVGPLPVFLYYHGDRELAEAKGFDHLHLTNRGKMLDDAARLVFGLLGDLLETGGGGEGLRAVIRARIAAGRSDLTAHDFEGLLAKRDEAVIGPVFPISCYFEGSIPAVLHLALKHADDPEAALVANTNLGGENCHRGAVLGALLGAAHGADAFPERWRSGLLEPPVLPHRP